MAIDAVQLILEGLKDHSARQFRQQELQLNKQRVDAETEAEKARIEQQKNNLNEQKRQFDLQHEITKKAADLVHSQTLQNIGLKTAETGIVPPGVSSQPVASSLPSGEANFSPANPQQATSNLLSFPGGESLNVPTPTGYAKQQADIQRIKIEPEVESDIKKSRLLQADLLKKQEEAKQADFLRSIVNKQFDDARVAKQIEAENWRAKLQRNTQLEIAKLARATSDIDLGPYAQDAIDGKITIEGINHLPLKAPEKMKIIDTVKKVGGGILSDKQADLVKDFGQIVGTIKYMDELIDNTPDKLRNTLGDNPVASGISGLINSNNKAVTGPEKELDARASVVARFLREKGNLSNRDIERVMGMFPSRYKPITTNIKMRDDFRNELDKLIESQLANLPKEQREIIKKRVGLADVSLYNKPQTQQVPGQSSQPGQPNNFSKPPTPSNINVRAELDRLGIPY